MPRYISNTKEQQEEMLREIGIKDLEGLFSDVPHEVRLGRDLHLPEALSELEMLSHLKNLAARNANAENTLCFLGAGSYDHFIPTVVGHLLSRQEFYTAYTPYQPEISQGTLQAIFEYQTMICQLTEMDVANASMYDGATALAEAASLAIGATKRSKVLVARSVHPESRAVLRTYTGFRGEEMEEFGIIDGKVDLEDLKNRLDDNTAAVIVQTPNFFGVIESLKAIGELAHEGKALFIVSCDPFSLSLLKAPGSLGADIAVGEGQSLGGQMNFGGPTLGFMAAKNALLRRMPGRIVGETTDGRGRRGFVLTIQTREQHIRREKATSNICSNQALNALAATIYLSVMGKEGLREAANLCVQKTNYAMEQLTATDLFKREFTAPFVKEVVLRYGGDIEELNRSLLKEGILGGYNLGKAYPELENCWLLAVTEKRTKSEIDTLVGKVVSFHGRN